jgi:uncharacterized membrane protein
MSAWVLVLAPLALLACAVVAGIFFAFSSFVMRALAQIPAAQGVAAMQSINVVVITPSFLATFFAGAVLSAVTGALALAQWGSTSALLFVAGALAYLVGTFLVTVLGNIPLNQRLANVTATDTAASAVWADYLSRWTMWNHVRTVAAFVAALLFLAGLLQVRGA